MKERRTILIFYYCSFVNLVIVFWLGVVSCFQCYYFFNIAPSVCFFFPTQKVKELLCRSYRPLKLCGLLLYENWPNDSVSERLHLVQILLQL